MRRLLLSLFIAASLSAQAKDAMSDGAKVHYESYGTGKDAVIFIHGWTCDLTFWRGQAPVYEKRRALLIDLPGHGLSAKPDVAYTQERFARAIDAVMRDAGVERAVLVGHSMGTPVALTFLRLYPAKVRGLVFVDGYIPVAPKDAAAAEAQKKQSASMAAWLGGPNYKDAASTAIGSMFSDKTTPAMREEIRTKMLSAPQQVMVSAIENMFAVEPPKPGETYATPLLSIRVRGGAAEEAQLRAVFPNLRKFDVWEGSGHFLMMESPERFNRDLSEFLDGIKF